MGLPVFSSADFAFPFCSSVPDQQRKFSPVIRIFIFRYRHMEIMALRISLLTEFRSHRYYGSLLAISEIPLARMRVRLIRSVTSRAYINLYFPDLLQPVYQ